jgi:hypothetical protein
LLCLSFLLPLGAQEKQTLLYQTGFENGAEVVPIDASRPDSDDDVRDARGPGLEGIKLYYEGGDATMRWGRIVPEPGNPTNHILHFWLGKANAKNASKGRIQADLKGLQGGVKTFACSMRLLLPPAMEVLQTYPSKITWLTLMEVWNNAPLKPYPFRVTVGLHKESKESGPLHFHVDAQDIDQTDLKKPKFITLWTNLDKTLEVPFGKWMTLEYELVEGDREGGRFRMAVTPEGGKRRVLFDITNHTHHTKDPAPDGFSAWNPLKLYTSRQVVEFMQGQGKALEAWWDDLEISARRAGE